MADIDLIELLNGVDINGGSARARATAAAALAAASAGAGGSNARSSTDEANARGRSLSPGGRAGGGGSRPTSGSPLPARIAEGVFRDERGIPTDRFLEALKRDPALVLQKLEDHCASEWGRVASSSSQTIKNNTAAGTSSSTAATNAGYTSNTSNTSGKVSAVRDAEAEARMQRLNDIVNRPQSYEYAALGRRRSTGDAAPAMEKMSGGRGQTQGRSRHNVRYASVSDGENDSDFDEEDSDSDSDYERTTHSLDLDGRQTRRILKKVGTKSSSKATKGGATKSNKSEPTGRGRGSEHDKHNINERYDGVGVNNTTATTQGASNVTAAEAEDLRKKVAKEKLRIAGQLQTIRTLEVKLTQAEQGIKERDHEIATLRNKLLQAEKREQALGGRTMPSTTPTAVTRVYSNAVTAKPSTSPSKVEEREAIRKLKAEIVQLNERLRDTNTRMQQSNERHKIVKSAFDRLKADFDDHREVKARVELSLSDTQNALIKCRRELKEAHSKMEGLKADVSTYAESDRKAKEEVRLANSAVQQLEAECERYRRDLVRQGTDIAYLQENGRRMELELRLLRDRDTSRAIGVARSALRGGREAAAAANDTYKNDSLLRGDGDHVAERQQHASRSHLSSNRSGGASPPRPIPRGHYHEDNDDDDEFDVNNNEDSIRDDQHRSAAGDVSRDAGATRRAQSASPYRPVNASMTSRRQANAANDVVVDWGSDFKLHQNANASAVVASARGQGASRPPLYGNSNTTSELNNKQRSPPCVTRPMSASAVLHSRDVDSHANDNSNSAIFNQSAIMSTSHQSLNNSLEQTKLKHDKLQQMYERITRNKGSSVNPMRNSHDL